MSIVGIDLGSFQSKLGARFNQKIDIVLDEGSKRTIKTIVGYSDQQRYIGFQGEMKQKSNFNKSITNFSRSFNIDNISEIDKLSVSCPINLNPEKNRLEYIIKISEQEQRFFPEQVTAAFLTKLRQTLSLNQINDTQGIIAVPCFFTDFEKKALIQACQIASFIPQRLITDTYALMLQYGFYKRNEMKEDKYVVFIDIGHSKTNVFLSRFNKQRAELLTQKYERNFGAKNFDYPVYQKYKKLFEQITSKNIEDLPKSKVRLLEGIIQSRQQLSSNNEHHLYLESLYQDIDLEYLMKREEFELLIQDELSKFKFVINDLKRDLDNFQVYEYEIEILGGGSYIPVLQKTIKNILKEEGKRKMTTDSIALGATLASALSSDLLKKSDNPYQVKEFNCKQIQFRMTGGESEVKNTLFEIGVIYPLQRSQTFDSIDKNLTMEIYQEENKKEHIIHKIELPIQNSKVKITFTLDRSGLVNVKDVQRQDQQELIDYKQSNLQLESENINYFIGVEQQFIQNDKEIYQMHELQNKIESIIINYENSKNRLLEYCTDDQQQSIQEIINMECVNLDEYQQKYSQIENTIVQILKREAEYKNIKEYFIEIESDIQNIEKDANDLQSNFYFIKNMFSKKQKDKKKNIDEKTKNKLLQLAFQFQTEMYNIKEMISKQNRQEDPKYRLKDVQNKHEKFRIECDQLFS